MKFPIKDFFSKCDQNSQFPADLVTFTEEILHGKLHFLCSVSDQFSLLDTMETSKNRRVLDVFSE